MGKSGREAPRKKSGIAFKTVKFGREAPRKNHDSRQKHDSRRLNIATFPKTAFTATKFSGNIGIKSLTRIISAFWGIFENLAPIGFKRLVSASVRRLVVRKKSDQNADPL